MIEKFKKEILLGFVILTLIAFSYWYFKKASPVGFSPGTEDPPWLPSVLIPSSEPIPSAWLSTQWDPETQFIQVYLYQKDATDTFQVFRLTSSEGDKNNPRWGMNLSEEREECSKTIFFIAENLTAENPNQELRFVCFHAQKVGEEITLVGEKNRISQIISYDLKEGSERADIALSLVTPEGGFYLGQTDLFAPPSEAPADWLKTIEHTASVTQVLFLPQTSYVLLVGENTNSHIQEIELLQTENLETFIVSSLPDTRFREVSFLDPHNLALLGSQLSREEGEEFFLALLELSEDFQSWCTPLKIFSLPKNFSGKKPIVWAADSRGEKNLEVILETVNAEGVHEINYLQGQLPTDCSPTSSYVTEVQKLEWLKTAPLSCIEDSRNPTLIPQTDAAPQLSYFKLNSEEETATLTQVNIQKALEKSCECAKDEDCDDGSPCTGDHCVDNTCHYEKTDPNCCNTNEECPDQICLNHVCTNPEINPTPSRNEPTIVPTSTTPEKQETSTPKKVSSCTQDEDCSSLNDPCKGNYYCNKNNPNGAVCTLNFKTVVECKASKNPCQQIACNSKTGKCEVTLSQDGAVCKGQFDSCHPNNVCQKGECSKGKFDTSNPLCECEYDNGVDCQKKEDGNACNGTLYCDLATHKCLLNPATSVMCPSVDNTACLKNTCNQKTGKCEFAPEPDGLGCDDTNICTKGEHCVEGNCTAGAKVCECTSEQDCADKNKGDLCQGNYYCDYTIHKCTINPKTVVTCSQQNSSCNPKTGVCTSSISP